MLVVENIVAYQLMAIRRRTELDTDAAAPGTLPALFRRIQLAPLTPELDAALARFYRTCASERLLIENYNRPLPDDLVRALHAFLGSVNHQTPDSSVVLTKLYENLVPLWRLSQKRNRDLWSALLVAITAWERTAHATVYKGPLFYHWGESHIRYGDPDKGFILLHRAQEEDRRVAPQTIETPAHWFLSLDDGHACDLQVLTSDMATFVQTRLAAYQHDRSGGLSYKELRASFLDANDPALADLQLFFAYTTFKLIKLRVLYKLGDVADDQMAPLVYTTVLSNLLLVVDRMFKLALYGGTARMNTSFLDHLITLKDFPSHHQAERYRHAIGNARLYDENFEHVLGSLLDGTYRTNDGAALDPLERDVMVAYRLRNYSAHSVKSQRYLWQRFPEVTQAVYNALFLAIQKR